MSCSGKTERRAHKRRYCLILLLHQGYHGAVTGHEGLFLETWSLFYVSDTGISDSLSCLGASELGCRSGLEVYYSTCCTISYIPELASWFSLSPRVMPENFAIPLPS